MWIVFFPGSNTETRSAGQALTEKQLLKVAQTLGQEWEPAAIHLGLETKDLEDIKAEHRPLAMQKQKMLVLWKRRRPPGEATAQYLLEGLKDLEDLPVETRLLLRGNLLHPHAHTHTKTHTHTHTHSQTHTQA